MADTDLLRAAPTVPFLDLGLLHRDLKAEILAEIAELVWFGPDSDRRDLTPILLNRILPNLIARTVLPWSAA